MIRAAQKGNLYKDTSPEDTIKRIRSILKNNRIPTRIEQKINNSNRLFSIGLHIRGFDFHVNGKGVTEPYACASAYAELMERLQNQIVFRFTEFSPALEKNFGFKVDSREKIFKSKQIPRLTEDFKKVLLYSDGKNAYNVWNKLREVYILKKCPVTFIPFYNLAKEKIAYLPRTFLFNLVGSNGMCAGNNQDEALVQGLCEILERFVSKKFYFEQITPPTIPRAYLHKYAPEQFNLIRSLEKSGNMEIIVKDCSLGKKFPVIATLIIFKETKKYTVNIGSFPLWQFALERCLTEAFQGQKVSQYKNATPLDQGSSFDGKMDFDNFMSLVICSKGEYPPSLFGTNPDYDFKGFGQQNFQSQKEMRKYLIKMIQDQGYNIFIRDVSFLGFPSYQIVVPGMSEIHVLSRRDWNEMAVTIPILNYVTRIKSLQRKELMELAADMENFIAEQVRSPFTSFSAYLGMPITDYRPWYIIPLQLIMACIYFHAGNLTRAAQCMDESIVFLENSKYGQQLLWIYASRDFLSLMAKNFKNVERTVGILGQFYDTTTVENVRAVFDKGNDIAGMVKIFFPDFELPHCWDCKRCRVKRYCSYLDLEKIQIALMDGIRNNPIDQRSMGDYLKV